MFEWGRAICYSGYRRNQSPAAKIYPSYDEVVEDLQILVDLGFKYIRMYDPVNYARTGSAKACLFFCNCKDNLLLY